MNQSPGVEVVYIHVWAIKKILYAVTPRDKFMDITFTPILYCSEFISTGGGGSFSSV